MVPAVMPRKDISSRTLEDPTNLRMMARLFLAHGGDYYASTGKIPEYLEYPGDPSLLKIPGGKNLTD